jgi:arylsulfatase A-like enzyme
LTGQVSHNDGVWDNAPPSGGWSALRPTQTNTLPVWLQKAGYATLFIGKWLNGYGVDNPKEIPAGWTQWLGAVGGSWNDYVGVTLNENGRLTRYKKDYQTDLYTDRARGLIDQYAGSRQPFFLWLCYVAPHTGTPRERNDPPGFATAVPAPQDVDRFAWLPLPKPPSYDEVDVSDKPRHIRALARIDTETEAKITEAYQQQLESLQAVDRGVASIVSQLAATGVLDRTLIVFTSDNGYLNGEHRVYQSKALPYEPSIRVPLIMRGPGVARHRVSPALVSNVDLAATFVDFAAARPGRTPDGRSLRSLLRDPSRVWSRDLLIESPLLEGSDEIYTAIRTDRYIWIEYRNGDRELYDLNHDPSELNNLQADRAHRSVRTQLSEKLARLRTCTGASCR